MALTIQQLETIIYSGSNKEILEVMNDLEINFIDIEQQLRDIRKEEPDLYDKLKKLDYYVGLVISNLRIQDKEGLLASLYKYLPEFELVYKAGLIESINDNVKGMELYYESKYYKKEVVSEITQLSNSINVYQEESQFNNIFIEQTAHANNLDIGQYIDHLIEYNGIDRFYKEFRLLQLHLEMYYDHHEPKIIKKYWNQIKLINKYLELKKMPTYTCKDSFKCKELEKKLNQDILDYKNKQAKKINKQIELNLFEGEQ